ncbi:MAG TPA: AMP-binding protein [Rudaea sp.]
MVSARPSYVSGSADSPLLGETIGTCLDRIARDHADGDAVVSRHQNIRWTWREVRERAERVACGLLRLGLNPGDRIGIWAPNCAEWMLMQLGAATAGLILVTINPAYRRSELDYALNKVGCTALVLAPSFKSSDYLAILRDIAPELAQCAPGDLRSARLPQLRTVVRLGEDVSPGLFNFDALLAAPDAAERARLDAVGAALSFDDPVNIQFTSGTTGAPKGATLTHHNILNNGFFAGEAIGLGARDRLCIPIPLYHCFAMVACNLAGLTHGATLVYPSDGFDPQRVLEAIHAERCTVLYGVPTMFIAELSHPQFARYDLSSLRTGVMGGSPCPVEVVHQVIERMHLPAMTVGYGMTETSPVSFQGRHTDPLERRVASVGRIHPYVEAKIIDANGRIVARGQPGELCVRGYSVMRGYWEDAQKTAEVIDAAGWMHTGDLAVIDEEGWCDIVGRSKDVVIRGGENIYPREVEEFLHRHPSIQDVQCVGVPDRKFGEELCACIIARPGATIAEADLRAFCEGEIAHYKVPRYFCFVESFPMTVTGKIQKFVLRDEMARRLGLMT